MKLHVSALLGLALVVALAVPTEAQTSADRTAPIHVSAGYHFLSFAPGGGDSMPAGVYAGVNSTGKLGFAGEVDANFKSVSGVALKNYAFLGGVRFTGRSHTPYVQVLAGLAHTSASLLGVSVTVDGFTIAPSGGVDVFTSDSNIGVRLQAGLQFSRQQDFWSKGVTLGLGIVFGVGQK